jgi:hypothetical protein
MSLQDYLFLPFDITKKYIAALNSRRKYSKETLSKVKNISNTEFRESIINLIKNPNIIESLNLLKDMTGSTVWVTRAYLRHLSAPLQVKYIPKHLKDSKTQYILKYINRDKPIPDKNITCEDVFKAVYDELNYTYYHPHHECKITGVEIKPTIVLVSGVFNEIFKTAAFERGAEHLSNELHFKYITAKVDGIKSTEYNAELLKTQLEKYCHDNPNEKLWLFSYSKGGIDCLHFLRNNIEFSNKKILGLSTVATPILGTNHLNNRILKIINSIHRFEGTKVYNFLSENRDFLAKEFQRTLSAKFQGPWFKENYSKLPDKLFYSALALESQWYESHVWMILAKFLLSSKSPNDGVVDSDHALFPPYFEASNFGIIKGHHLVGSRSSFYSQEALLEAHIITMKYLKILE